MLEIDVPVFLHIFNFYSCYRTFYIEYFSTRPTFNKKCMQFVVEICIFYQTDGQFDNFLFENFIPAYFFVYIFEGSSEYEAHVFLGPKDRWRMYFNKLVHSTDSTNYSPYSLFSLGLFTFLKLRTVGACISTLCARILPVPLTLHIVYSPWDCPHF